MTLTEAEEKINGLEEALRLARDEAHSAKMRANAALKFLRDLGRGLDADMMGAARDVANAIELEFGKID
jgi:hypothetical protein